MLWCNRNYGSSVMIQSDNDSAAALGRDVRRLVRGCLTGSLATLEPDTKDPAVSLVSVSTDIAGAPVLLISNLAQHTKNLKGDKRAAILFEDREKFDTPLEGGRVSLRGHAEPLDDARAIERYLRHHPDAEAYVSLGDFHFYRLIVDRAYFVGGFGRIFQLAGDDILLKTAKTQKLAEAEQDIIEHMNQDHSDAVALYARMAGFDRDREWRMTGIDPEGLDIRDGGTQLRLDFARDVTNAKQAREALIELAQAARQAASG